MGAGWMMGVVSGVGLWILAGWMQLSSSDPQVWAQVSAPGLEIRLDPDLPLQGVPPDPFDLAQALPSDRGGWLPRLGLSPAQMMQLRSIQQQAQGDLGQKTQELRQLRRELRDALAGDVSTDQVREQYRRMKQLSREIDDRRFEAILRVREVLTPEQRQRMADLLAERSQEFRDQVRDQRLQARPRLRR